MKVVVLQTLSGAHGSFARGRGEADAPDADAGEFRLPEQVYEEIIRRMPGNLKHREAQSRRYAAKSMVAHHLARVEDAAIRPYPVHTDPAVVRGALEVLYHALNEGAY